MGNLKLINAAQWLRKMVEFGKLAHMRYLKEAQYLQNVCCEAKRTSLESH